MGKTPYELRYDLLLMAQAIITENLMNERIRLENDWNVENNNNPVIKKPFPEIPKINPDDIIAMANKLNVFVSKDN